MNPKFSRFIAGGGDYTALIRLPADNDGFPPQFGLLKQFDGDEEGVHVNVQNRRDRRRRPFVDGTMDCTEASQFRHVS